MRTLTACPCCNTSTGSYRRPLFQPTECLIRPCVMIPCAVLRGAEHVHAISVLLLAFDGLGSCFGQPRPQHETRISADTVAGPGAKGGSALGAAIVRSLKRMRAGHSTYSPAVCSVPVKC
jgi:hypothetical protein